MPIKIIVKFKLSDTSLELTYGHIRGIREEKTIINHEGYFLQVIT